MILKTLGVALGAVVLLAPAYGNNIFMPGNHPQSNEQNILFTSTQTGSTVFGFTIQSDTKVQFSSTTDKLDVTSNGQANVTATDGLINDLTISVPGLTFGDLILNPFKPDHSQDLTITVTMGDGSTLNFGYGNTNGNNFLTIVAPGNEVMKSVTIDSKWGFEDLKQPRISSLSADVRNSPTPEPSSMLLLGGGVVGLASVLRRKML